MAPEYDIFNDGLASITLEWCSDLERQRYNYTVYIAISGTAIRPSPSSETTPGNTYAGQISPMFKKYKYFIHTSNNGNRV